MDPLRRAYIELMIERAALRAAKDAEGQVAQRLTCDEALFKLLDDRYRHELPTAIGSNLPPDDLEERISSRVQDGALSVVVRMRGPDRRRGRRRVAG